MIFKIINTIFQLGLVIIFVILLLSSVKVMYLNIKYFHIIKYGEIIDFKYIKGSQSDGQRGTYSNVVLMEEVRDTITGGTQEHLSVGDKVKFRYIGATGNKIFEVNNKIIGSKYDVWDWVSPFLFLFTSFMLYKFAELWFSFIKK